MLISPSLQKHCNGYNHGELLKERPKARHKVDNKKGCEAEKKWERPHAVTIDGRAKMKNMRLFVSRTERGGGAAQFITVTSSLVPDEDVDASTEGGGADRAVKAPVVTDQS